MDDVQVTSLLMSPIQPLEQQGKPRAIGTGDTLQIQDHRIDPIEQLVPLPQQSIDRSKIKLPPEGEAAVSFADQFRVVHARPA